MKIKDKEYDLKLNYSSYKKLQSLWECESFYDVLKKMNDISRLKVTLGELELFLVAGLSHTGLVQDDVIGYLNSFGADLSKLWVEIDKAIKDAMPDEPNEEEKKNKKPKK